MKTITYLLAFILTGIFGCNQQTNVQPINKTKQLFVVIYDISKSNDSYAFLKPENFSNIYTYMGNNGGGKLYGLLVTAKSNSQEPFSATISSLDTLKYKGNRIQIGHIKQNNYLLVNKFESGRSEFIERSAGALLKEKKEQFSDVQNALLLAKQIVNMPEYASWNKKILIISDMENDLPPTEGLDPLVPIEFGVNVTIGIVRPSNRIQISKIFPKLTATNYSTIEDGIKSLIILNL